MELDYPNNLYDIIEQTYKEKNNEPLATYQHCLIKVLKKHHMWPALQVKKFKNNNDLVLLHNSYDKKDVDEKFQAIYHQCRSVILDFSLYLGENIVVVSYANNIPVRININEYTQIVNDADKYQEAYDGTMVTVYNYKDEWYFGTSTCTDINYSKFAHPTKSHGDMFNEILMNIYSSCFTEEEIINSDDTTIENKLRNLFVSNLDKSIAYEFVLIHHENNHIIDYSEVYGKDYKFIYHINSKNRVSLCEEDIHQGPLANIGVLYPTHFSSLNDAYNHINTNKSYGFIVKKICDDGVKLFKISPVEISIKEDTDPCKPNIWHNLLIIYMKNKKEFKISDYINMYNPDLKLPKDNNNRDIDPTYLIHTTISTFKDILYNLYMMTTTYNPKTNRFKMNKEIDAQFPPIIRFHLAQLRHRQINNHNGTMIKPTDVYYYICKCNNIKNIKLLVAFFATSSGFNIPDRASICLSTLDSLL